MRVDVHSLQAGQQVDEDYLLRDVKTGTTKRGTPFIRCLLCDKSGSLVAVFWNWDGKEIPSGVVRVRGRVDEYQGSPQIVIETISKRESTSDENFIKTTRYSVEKMWDQIVNAVYDMKNDHIRNVAYDLLLKQGYHEAFKTCPAATTMHHAFQGGLLEHTHQMVEMARSLFRLKFLSETLNQDLCIFGLIFHDFGKIFEYEHGGTFQPTLQGRLVPHIPMTGALIFESANKHGVPEIIRDHMMHVVLAHHGCMEYGSPVDMAIPEAAFVHYVDNMHGDIFGWRQATAQAAGSTVRHGGRLLVTQPFDDVLGGLKDISLTEDFL